MARTIKEQEYVKKRNEILDSAQQFLFTKGYERMAIQDIITDLNISSGAFYHYFNSKTVLLEALIERMQQEAEQLLLPIVHDLNLSAQEKLRSFFTEIDNLKIANKSFLLRMIRGWYSDNNAIVRQKVNEATIERRTPLLALIVNQGIQENVFAVFHPIQTAEVILSLTLSMENTFARLLLSSEREHDEPRFIENIVATHDGYINAIERVLGAPSHFLDNLDAETVRRWFEGKDTE